MPTTCRGGPRDCGARPNDVLINLQRPQRPSSQSGAFGFGSHEHCQTSIKGLACGPRTPFRLGQEAEAIAPLRLAIRAAAFVLAGRVLPSRQAIGDLPNMS
jgi:hypothetical protein